jgi:inorganic pyrophosphatase/exopolyphosphatase
MAPYTKSASYCHTLPICYAEQVKIITSGSRYLDIDAYAGIIAYAELLQQLGLEAEAVSTATLNQSIPAVVREWGAPLTTDYTPSPLDTYTLIDISEPEYFEEFVDLDRIDEIIDHHPGMENYWQERIGDAALIEQVGAACTQVYELWEEAGLGDQISETSARLLMCGILDNTLNFGAAITTERDHDAYAALAQYANLPDDWPQQYFSACQHDSMQDVAQSVLDNSKVITFKTFTRPVGIGQLALWDPTDAVQQSFDTFKQAVTTLKPDWFMNIIGIDDNKSYFVTDAPEVQKWLEDLLDVHFNENIAIADRTWLRKEIMAADIDKDK